MNDFDFCLTDDGSLGLYDNIVNDIYHARQGAYTEACDKFSCPAVSHLKDIEINNILYVSDICYGIGYNTISFIEKLSKNILINDYKKILITVFEMNEELIILSPFVKSNNYNWIIRLKLLNSIKKVFQTSKIYEICNKYKDFIDIILYKRFKGDLKFTNNISCMCIKKRLFLHNTYYNYISNRFKNSIKLNNIKKFKIVYKTGNARFLISDIKHKQNIVFLDAFDPKKCPTLWTEEFFKLLYQKVDDNFKLLTYSHATSIRSAMLNAKFYIGLNNEFGTVATKNIKFINQQLSDYEKGLLNTNAGIAYKDYNKKYISSEEIIQDRLRRIKTENRESSTHYAKTHHK